MRTRTPEGERTPDPAQPPDFIRENRPRVVKRAGLRKLKVRDIARATTSLLQLPVQ
jgi:hypothetical protein